MENQTKIRIDCLTENGLRKAKDALSLLHILEVPMDLEIVSYIDERLDSLIADKIPCIYIAKENTCGNADCPFYGVKIIEITGCNKDDCDNFEE